MKRSFKRRMFALILMVCLALSCVGCDKEIFIPTEFGEPEGLYLYFGEYRSLTDGTQRERILKEITIDGTAYSNDEIRIFGIKYVTEKKLMYFFVDADKPGEKSKYAFVKFNYDAKEYEVLKVITADSFSFDYSDCYAYIMCHSSNDAESVVFDYDGNIVAEDLNDYFLEDNFLYKSDGYTFSWWFKGKNFSVEVNDKNGENKKYDKVKCGDYAYLFTEKTVKTVNLETGENQTKRLEENAYVNSAKTHYGQPITKGDAYYVITYSEKKEVGYNDYYIGCKLWRFKGFESNVIYTFPEKYDVKFYEYTDGNYVDLELSYNFGISAEMSAPLSKYWNFDIKNESVTKKFKDIKPTDKAVRRLTVGEYEFYVLTDIDVGLLASERYYYLYRIHNGKEEIVQFYSDHSYDRTVNPILFDDIHVR